MKTLFTCLALTTIALLLTPQTITAQCHNDDWAALKVFYENTTNWRRSIGWSETFTNHNTPPEGCNLEDVLGISLNEEGRVKYINLTRLDIKGSLPAQFGLLTDLESITMYYNELSGPIPPEIGNLKKLTSIWLSDNQLSGDIPDTFGNLTNLTRIDISRNQLSGNIPSQLGNLINLERLVFDSNQLSGNIPASLGNLSSLNTMFLDNNNLSGAIPSELANSSMLTFFDLSNNRLTGTIPNGLGDLTELRRFILNDNNLTGSLPEGIGQQTELFAVYVSNNQLSGCYPPNLAALCDDMEGNAFVSDGNNFDTTWENFCETGNGVCELEGEEVILDCTDAVACNYNPNANYENGSCIYTDIQIDCPCGTIPGCSDPNANNYNASADCDNGFCEYDNALQPGEYDYVFCRPFDVKTILAKTCPSGNFSISENADNIAVSINAGGQLEIEGINDGISTTVKIMFNNNNNCSAEWTFNLIGSDFPECRDIETDEVLLFHPWVTNIVDISNCEDKEVLLVFNIDYDVIFPSLVYINSSEGGTLYSSDGRFICADYTEGETLCVDQFYGVGGIEDRWICPNSTLIPGCTNPSACNYNPDAQTDDFSCEYPNNNCDIPCNSIVGCTKEIAINYDSFANCDDGTCQFEGFITPQCHADDWTALKALYESTNSPYVLEDYGLIYWADTTGWEEVDRIAPTANCNLANLFGVTLNNDNRVDTINLPNNGLSGALPSALESLSDLRYLSLDNNRLYDFGNLWDFGAIPPELGSLANLEYLSLANCSLDGNIPPELSNLSNLKELHLNGNGLRGSIPSELANLQNLEVLSLWRNRLDESIPPELGNLNNLKRLDLKLNELSGNIPPELGNLSNLEELSLAENLLNGSIPPELGNLSNLMELYLQTNQFSGNIPSQLGDLNNLTHLWLFSNELSSNIPPELGNLSNLIWLSLRDNQFSGNIPPELGNLSSLEEMSFRNNQLSGSIPTELGSLSNLKELYLNNNQLNGGIPSQLADLSNLTILEVNDNDLSGCYPTNLNTLCTQINNFVFDYNPVISEGNNFDASWRDFCDTDAGACVGCISPPSIGTFNCE